MPFCNAWTLAPLIAVPPELLDTVPDRVPVVMAVKVTPLLVCPLTVTVTGPVVDPLGTGTAIALAPQVVTDAGRPLKRTTLSP